jgi:hypothetical protein
MHHSFGTGMKRVELWRIWVAKSSGIKSTSFKAFNECSSKSTLTELWFCLKAARVSPGYLERHLSLASAIRLCYSKTVRLHTAAQPATAKAQQPSMALISSAARIKSSSDRKSTDCLEKNRSINVCTSLPNIPCSRSMLGKVSSDNCPHGSSTGLVTCLL